MKEPVANRQVFCYKSYFSIQLYICVSALAKMSLVKRDVRKAGVILPELRFPVLEFIFLNMADNEKEVFTSLFREACEKCFSRPLSEALKEPDAKRLSDEILEKTGLVIGWKSIKNFSLYTTQPGMRREENPSLGTLDTLARYVQDAPVTDEAKRKATESHYPYWYNYKRSLAGKFPDKKKSNSGQRRKIIIAVCSILIVGLAGIFVNTMMESDARDRFADDFGSVRIDSLAKKGWILKNSNVDYWNKRDYIPGHLTLYTLLGDNWPDEKKSFGLKNLLTRRIDSDCFSTEIHLTDFVPYQNWQQAGILLSEDSTFEGNVVRLSMGYNNFFGGFARPSEIIIQVVASNSPAGISKPEEIAHMVLFTGDPQKDTLISTNLSKSALKIEKRGNHYRFMFTTGRMESFAFRPIAILTFSQNTWGYSPCRVSQIRKTPSRPLLILLISLKLTATRTRQP
jgi:hypothetical protein